MVIACRRCSTISRTRRRRRIRTRTSLTVEAAVIVRMTSTKRRIKRRVCGNKRCY
ncbi:hypothetical protein MIMGU_mgv1a017614mg [Erythranthe guttata]|uniref:Uncharacterized protein n=1 Tax=Erythranthe guttata TaxID=4155 RepID=A0A022Q6X6_ERYGU|nr:hypothetical protein MIMGU_mgv1a017614mg [Erythranthe guttata]